MNLVLIVEVTEPVITSDADAMNHAGQQGVAIRKATISTTKRMDITLHTKKNVEEAIKIIRRTVELRYHDVQIISIYEPDI